jgi:lambda family phage portal protein
MFDLWGLLKSFGGGKAAALPKAQSPQKTLIRQAVRQAIRARYDNALWTDENQRAWWMSDYFSAKSANNFQVRRMLRMRARYEVANNPYLFGVVNSNADDLINTGPTLQVTTDNKSYNRQVEKAWKEWADEVDLVEKLRTCKLARTVDGEGFLILKTVNDLYNSVKLYPVDVEADQVTTPAPANLADLWVDGLTLHPVTGRPTAYHVLRHHPGDMFFPDFNPLRVDKINAKYIVHWFLKFRPGQVRGVPVFTSALDLFTELRAFRKAVLQKAQVAANLTAVLETEARADDGTDDDTADEDAGDDDFFDHIPIARGVMTTLPGGNKLHQFESGDPSTTYEIFQEKCLGEACRPMRYPLNLALGTSQKFNFSSAKLDHVDYRESLSIERSQCDTQVLKKIFYCWFEEAQMVPKLLPSGAALAGTPHEWHWPGFPILDPAVDTQADIDQIQSGTMTWQQFWASRGYDWREVMQQQAEERKEVEKLGLVFAGGDKAKSDGGASKKPQAKARQGV